MSVQRFKVEELNCCFQADMVESEDGDYVLHSDYAVLAAENERLRKAGDAMLHRLLLWHNDDYSEAWNAAKEGRDAK